MWRSFKNIGLLVLALMAARGIVGINCTSAQMIKEPTLEGVSYAEIAEWQGRYGGGPVPGYLHPGMPSQAYGCFPPPPNGWVPPVCNPKKKSRIRRR